MLFYPCLSKVEFVDKTSSFALPLAPCRTDWLSISLLIAVSALAQIGQFGIVFVVLPLWLTERGLDATQLGLFNSTLWLGMLPGLMFAPRLSRRHGPRRVILAGLCASTAALLLIPLGGWLLWLLAGTLAGFGLGLRWIGLEPWLYRITPAAIRGQLVGGHETMIGLSPIIAPALAGWLGVTTHAPFVLGISFIALAALVLASLRPPAPAQPEPPQAQPNVPLARHSALMTLGVALALTGGVIDAAFNGLFPLFGAGRQLDARQIATLLTLFGMGGLLLQYVIGWLSDHRGLKQATLVVAGGTLLMCALLTRPLGHVALYGVMFVLGGCVTAYLTLALVAATTAPSRTLAQNVGRISMSYTASAACGPLLAGGVMHALGGDALLWQIGGMAALLCLFAIGVRRA
jgi:MFS family permease